MRTFLLCIVSFSCAAQQKEPLPYSIIFPIPSHMRTPFFWGDTLTLHVSKSDAIKASVSQSDDEYSQEISLENILLGAALCEQEEAVVKTQEEILSEYLKGEKKKNNCVRTYCSLPLSDVAAMISQLNTKKWGSINYLGRTLILSKVSYRGGRIFLRPSYLPSKSPYSTENQQLELHFNDLLESLKKRFLIMNAAGRVILNGDGSLIVKKDETSFLLGKENDKPVGVFVKK